jgi:hypothetical protein
VLKPGEVIGIADGSVDHLPVSDEPTPEKSGTSSRALSASTTRENLPEALQLRALLRKAGFARTQSSGNLNTEDGPPAGSLDDAQNRTESLDLYAGWDGCGKAVPLRSPPVRGYRLVAT